ncbi:MAG: ATP-binding cassette domain-containing protein [Minwuia sp.]|uniref:ABC transporter ATP-binding protein n=1 Tax=Minwuia sp. TaxID=2493630 RepID=UPI003A86092A
MPIDGAAGRAYRRSMNHGDRDGAAAGLEVRGLTSGVVRGCSFSLPPGTGIALSGPSGSGKTSLFRALADLDPNEGDVTLDGQSRESMKPGDWRRRVAYVPAEPAWWLPHAGDHLDEAGRAGAGRLGLDAKLFRKPSNTLSTGERQRLAMAMTFAREPQVLLLDEPTSALDEENRDRVEALIRERLDRGASVLMTSHDPKQIERLGFPVMRIAEGRITPPDATP